MILDSLNVSNLAVGTSSFFLILSDFIPLLHTN